RPNVTQLRATHGDIPTQTKTRNTSATRKALRRGLHRRIPRTAIVKGRRPTRTSDAKATRTPSTAAQRSGRSLRRKHPTSRAIRHSRNAYNTSVHHKLVAATDDGYMAHSDAAARPALGRQSDGKQK